MSERCERLGKLIGACRFEAVYERNHPDKIIWSDFRASPAAAKVVFDSLKREKYIGHVCIRCGKKVDRP